MEILYVIMAVGVVVYFGGALTKLANVAENGIGVVSNTTDTVLKLTDDTVGTYSYEVRLSNGEKRKEIANRAKKMKDIPTLNQLEAMFEGKA